MFCSLAALSWALGNKVVEKIGLAFALLWACVKEMGNLPVLPMVCEVRLYLWKEGTEEVTSGKN